MNDLNVENLDFPNMTMNQLATLGKKVVLELQMREARREFHCKVDGVSAHTTTTAKRMIIDYATMEGKVAALAATGSLGIGLKRNGRAVGQKQDIGEIGRNMVGMDKEMLDWGNKEIVSPEAREEIAHQMRCEEMLRNI